MGKRLKIGALLILAYIGLRWQTAFTTTLCMFRGTTGFPCPACGMTRAYKALGIMDLGGAFEAHPLFWLPPVVLMIVLFKGWRPIIKYRYPILVVVFGVYVVRLLIYYPHTYPMLYNEHALWPRLLTVLGLR